MASFEFTRKWGCHTVTVKGSNDRSGSMWKVYVEKNIVHVYDIPMRGSIQGSPDATLMYVHNYLDGTTPPHHI